MRVSIIGIGLIGGSLGMALKQSAGPACEVIGVARRDETLAEAIGAGAIDRGTLAPAEGVAGADVVVVCTPVAMIVPMLQEIAPYVPQDAVVTDVGSTKQHICGAAWESFRQGPLFIGGHPLTGSEREGVLAGDPYLFQNAVYVLTPPPDPRAEAGLERLLTLVRRIGAQPMVLDPERHDRIVAAVSHLPHVVAAALVRAVGQIAAAEPAALKLAAGGFRDTTRIASGPPDVWRDICLTNAPAIITMLDRFREAMDAFRAVLAAGDGGALEGLFGAAREERKRIPARAKGILAPVWELVVRVVDKPGAIHAVTGLLAAEGINIIDIEILRVREGEGGTLRLAVETPQALSRALATLAAGGYAARERA